MTESHVLKSGERMTTLFYKYSTLSGRREDEDIVLKIFDTFGGGDMMTTSFYKYSTPSGAAKG
jgi:hypothetical protein